MALFLANVKMSSRSL